MIAAIDIASVKVVVGAILLALCGGFAGAKIVHDAEWRLAERRRRARRGRSTDVDLTGRWPS